ncbi:MAG TPA: hypothetical protein VGQ37_17815 [Vicinamibacterales bacterium]|jgi:hypothetical protein|nr:hypothetical protein [Vicinamibacterales bacterium]
MNPEDLDRALSAEPDIVPSSGFAAAVMESVRAEATAPPLPFPWHRAWPLAAGLAAAVVWMVASQFGPAAALPGPDVFGWFETIAPMATGWVVSGLLMSIAVTMLSLRMVRGR